MKSGKKEVNNTRLIFLFKGKKEQYRFKHSGWCMSVLASHLYKQTYFIHSYTPTTTSKKIKSNLSTDVVMSLKTRYFTVFMLFNPVYL